MSETIQVVLQARTPSIGEWVEQCAKHEIKFDELCRRVSALGYRTTSLYEMVIAAEASLSQAK